jgi:hypothetical protein
MRQASKQSVRGQCVCPSQLYILDIALGFIGNPPGVDRTQNLLYIIQRRFGAARDFRLLYIIQLPTGVERNQNLLYIIQRQSTTQTWYRLYTGLLHFFQQLQ